VLIDDTGDAEAARAADPEPPSDIERTIAPRIVARPTPPPTRPARAVDRALGATIFAGLLGLRIRRCVRGVSPLAAPPMVPTGAPLPIGTTVIIRNDPGVARQPPQASRR